MSVIPCATFRDEAINVTSCATFRDEEMSVISCATFWGEEISVAPCGNFFKIKTVTENCICIIFALQLYVLYAYLYACTYRPK